MEFKVFQIWELKYGKIKNSSPFSKAKLENMSLKNVHVSFVRYT